MDAKTWRWNGCAALGRVDGDVQRVSGSIARKGFRPETKTAPVFTDAVVRNSDLK
jgi:hypothetical protein